MFVDDVVEDGEVFVGIVAGMIVGVEGASPRLRVVVGLGGGVVVFLWRDLVVVVGFRRWKWR